MRTSFRPRQPWSFANKTVLIWDPPPNPVIPKVIPFRSIMLWNCESYFIKTTHLVWLYECSDNSEIGSIWDRCYKSVCHSYSDLGVTLWKCLGQFVSSNCKFLYVKMIRSYFVSKPLSIMICDGAEWISWTFPLSVLESCGYHITSYSTQRLSVVLLYYVLFCTLQNTIMDHRKKKVAL